MLTELAWPVPHETGAILVQVLCIPYNHAPCHFMQSHICKVCTCLAVTCHLHFWQNDWNFLCATAVTLGWNGYRNKSAQRRSWRMKFSHCSCRDLNPRPFSHESGTLTTELSLLPHEQGHVCVQSVLCQQAETSSVYNLCSANS